MIPASNLWAFLLASVVLIVIPGPSVLFVIGRSLSLGRMGGLLSVVGNAAGMLPLVAAVEARATVGEISDVLRRVFGEYEETATV